VRKAPGPGPASSCHAQTYGLMRTVPRLTLPFVPPASCMVSRLKFGLGLHCNFLACTLPVTTSVAHKSLL